MQPSLCYWFSKDPNLCPSSPCIEFTQFLGMWEDENTLAPLPFLFCLIKTRVNLKNSSCVRRKDPERNQSDAKRFSLKKYNTVSIFLCWREQALSKGHDLIFHLIPGQGEGSKETSHPGPISFQEALQGMILLTTWGTFCGWGRGNQDLIFLLPSALPWSLVPVL